MATRKEQEIRLRREVRDIINSHMRETPFSIDNFVDDIMGALNQEDNYRVQDFQQDMDAIREKMREQHDSETKALRCQIDGLKAKIARLQKQVITDEIRKELERKIAILQDKNRTLKKLVQLSLEEM